MGLLTNTKGRNAMFTKLVNYKNRISAILYVAGVVGFLAIADERLNDGTYFSENALLPGLVDSQYVTAADADDVFRAIKASVKPGIDNASDVLLGIVSSRLTAAGLEVYTQDYTFQYPYNFMEGQVVKGRNVYGIVRGPRTASTEGIVLAVPLRPPASTATGDTVKPPPATDAAVALALSLAKHFRRYTYWAKDVIFVFTDNEHIGMQAWLDAYHGSRSSQYLNAGILPAHSGFLQAAINLELPSDAVSYINVKIEGINGQLPNLDLVNVVTRLCSKENIKPRLHHRADRWSNDVVQNLAYNFKTMLLMMLQQATCMASGNHGLFHRYGIQAVTIEGVKAKGGRQSDLFSVGRVVEGVFRSMNNLQERFHQSFFFYLLPNTARYASIGVYMIPFGLLAGGVLIQAIALWVKFGAAIRERDEQRSKDAEAVAAAAAAAAAAAEELGSSDDGHQPQQSGPAAESKVDGDGQGVCTDRGDLCSSPVSQAEHAAKMLSLPETVSQGLSRLLPLVLVSHLVGFVVYIAPALIAGVGQPASISPESRVLYGLVAVLAVALLMPLWLSRRSEADDANWELLKSIALLEHSALLLVVSLVNISLAAVLAVATVPVYSVLSPSPAKLSAMLKSLLALAVFAPIFGMAMLGVHTLLVADEGDITTVLVTVLSNLERSVTRVLIDGCVVGSWLYALVSLVLFPNWLLFWSLPWLQE